MTPPANLPNWPRALRLPLAISDPDAVGRWSHCCHPECAALLARDIRALPLPAPPAAPDAEGEA